MVLVYHTKLVIALGNPSPIARKYIFYEDALDGSSCE